MRLARILPALLAAALFVAVVSPVVAQPAARATLYVVQGVLPRTLGSANDVLRYARGHRARELHESNEPVLEQRTWETTIVVQFARPFTDRNFTLLFFDVTDGAHDALGSPMDVYVRGQEQTVVQSSRLPRTRFRPNRDIEIVLTVRHAEAGSARVHLVGEVPRGNGSVDFTRDDPG